MKPYFKLSRPKAKTTTSIYVQGYVKSQKFTIPFDEEILKIAPKDWNSKRQKADYKIADIIKKQEKDKLVNDKLAIISDQLVSQYFDYVSSNSNPSARGFKLFVQNYGQEIVSYDQNIGVFEFFYNEVVPNKRVGKKKTPLEKRTIDSYTVVLKKLSFFFDLDKRGVLSEIQTLEDLNKRIGRKSYQSMHAVLDNKISLVDLNDKKLINRFFRWIERFNYETNSKALYPKIITAILSHAFDTDYFDIRPVSYSKEEERKEPIIINDQEYDRILKVQNLNLEEEIAKDWTILLLNSGFRTGDVWELKNHHIDYEEEVIRKPMNKNGQSIGKVINAPCYHKDAKEILKKYEGFPPTKGLKNKLLILIKIVCEKSEIDAHIPIIKYKEGKRMEELVPKYKLMGIHALRRSFATRYYQNNYATLEQLMIILGHEDLDTTRRYVGAQETKALEGIKKNMEALGVT